MKAVVLYTIIDELEQNKFAAHLVGQKLLERGLKEVYNLDLDTEPIVKTEYGKPFLSLRPNIHFNISHSGKIVVVAFMSEEVGIDIQKHTKLKNIDGVLEKLVYEDMANEIKNSKNPTNSFFKEWVKREAFVKWTGKGFASELKSLPMNQGEYVEISIANDYSCGLWSLKPFEVELKEIKIQWKDVVEN